MVQEKNQNQNLAGWVLEKTKQEYKFLWPFGPVWNKNKSFCCGVL